MRELPHPEHTAWSKKEGLRPSLDYESKILRQGNLRGWLTEIERINSWPQDLQAEERASLHEALFESAAKFRF